MNLSKSEIIGLALVALSFVIAIYFYPLMPQLMASHWDINGAVNGYMSKFWGLFLMPMVTLIMWLLFLFVPRIDPKKANIAKFRKQFDEFVIVIFLFLLYVYALTLAWNLNYIFDFTRFIIAPFAILFYAIGNLVAKAEPNWFIGIRTPWTLSNEVAWRKTHQLGGKLYKISALISLLGLFLPGIAIWLVIIPIILVSLYLVIYSYIIFKQEKQNVL
ncbi:MAG: SdpI family protein [bacterium]